MAESLEEQIRRFNEQNPAYGARARQGNPVEPPRQGATERGNAAWAARYERQAPQGGQPGDPNAPVTQGGLEGAIADYLGGVTGGGPGDVIGDVPDWQGRVSWYGTTGRGGRFLPAPPAPYTDGFETAELRQMPAERRARLQEVLVAAGLAPSVIPGEIDDGTVQGFRRLLAMANRKGERYHSTLYRLQQSVARGEIGPGSEQDERDPFRFVEQEYLPPDPAEVRNSIRDLATKIVPDVEVSDEEIEYLRDQFEGMGAQQFRAAEHQRRHDEFAQYEADAPVAPGTEEVVTQSEGVQPVNAAERFREFFEDRYSANIERAEDVEQGTERRNMTQGNLGRLLQIATGR